MKVIVVQKTRSWSQCRRRRDRGSEGRHKESMGARGRQRRLPSRGGSRGGRRGRRGRASGRSGREKGGRRQWQGGSEWIAVGGDPVGDLQTGGDGGKARGYPHDIAVRRCIGAGDHPALLAARDLALVALGLPLVVEELGAAIAAPEQKRGAGGPRVARLAAGEVGVAIACGLVDGVQLGATWASPAEWQVVEGSRHGFVGGNEG